MISKGHLRQVAAELVARQIDALLQRDHLFLYLDPEEERRLREILTGHRSDFQDAAKQLSGLTDSEIADRVHQ